MRLGLGKLNFDSVEFVGIIVGSARSTARRSEWATQDLEST
jgi:hypothetical protein